MSVESELALEKTPKLLLVDDDESLLRLMSIRLKAEGFDVTAVDNGTQALRLMFNNEFDVVLSDLRMPGMDGLSLFDEVLQQQRDLPLILMTAHGTIADAVAATQRGVFSFLTKPVDHDELRKILFRAIAQTTKNDLGDWCEDIITRSPDMIKLLKQAEQVADKNVSVLINGASGTGKELLAKAIHKASGRKDKTFVAINCGALPENLLESELFGHAKGAFTGAVQANPGLFREADGGTLFLDEIGDMPITLQVKLLRALQERSVRPVGSTTSVDVDVRLISATHKNLHQAMSENEFREDLYYRLNVVNLDIPKLKDRFEDIPLLADYLLKESAEKHGINVIKFADDAISRLTKADWPGNVRQLVNVVERCVALTNSKIIPVSLVEQALSQETEYWPTLTEARDSFEYRYLCRLLQLTDGNVTRASDLAGRNRTDMHKLMKKHGLNAADFREVD
ncbi:sigma 54-interacting transcriptional regulator [Glaciecola sp. XM2]|uniref:sigma 54-interacting transcriptional regulator n=1 Tax=Glaciecola sp. XM2 TaxID=1914931 RepID=UPI002546F1F5|nr:sigma 54-interacting transcriptional regulator [Glaciecola sp. XM2]